MNHTINTSRTAAVATDVTWQPVLPSTPRGVRMLCIDKRSGVAQVGVIRSGEDFFTHWSPLPRWSTEGDAVCGIPLPQRPVAHVAGQYGGHSTYTATDRSAMLPIGMALYK